MGITVNHTAAAQPGRRHSLKEVTFMSPTAQVEPTPIAQAATDHFDRNASTYGNSRMLKSPVAKALADLAPRADDRVLDVACGTGDLLGEIADHVQRAVGIDQSDGMLKIARENLLEEAGPDGRANLELRQASSDELPFADGEFTAVVCTTALHHFPEPQRSFDEMARVLAPGGRLVIGDVCADRLWVRVTEPLLRRFDAGHVGVRRKDDIEAMLTRAGLRVTKSAHHWMRFYALVTAQRPSG